MRQFEDVSRSFYFRGRMRPALSRATLTADFEENFGLVAPPRMRNFRHKIAVTGDGRLLSFDAPEEAERFLAEEAVRHG